MDSRRVSFTRRRFVQGLALSGTALGLGLSPRQLLASQGHTGAAELSGNTFRLHIDTCGINITGSPARATLVNGNLPAPTLHWQEGDTVTLAVTNHLPHPTSIHWHGILLPFRMDGVPGLSFDGIQPGETFTHQFPVRQNGTYWYHSHSGFQEQSGLYGALVIHPREPHAPAYQADRDYVVVLSDWSDEDPERIYAHLKLQSDYYNFNQRTLFDTLHDFREKGLWQTIKDRHMWNDMRMSQTDLADVTGQAYTYLMNGNTPAGNWSGLFRPGERVRLRLINASAMSFFDIRIPGLDMTAIAMDGQAVEPVSFHECRLGTAETLDVIVTPMEHRAYTLFAQSIDRAGYARGTLTPEPGLAATVPELDPPPLLGHREMGMGSMAGMSHSSAGHAPTSAMPMEHAHANHGHMHHGAMTSGDMESMPTNHAMSGHGGTHGMDMSQPMATKTPATTVPFAVSKTNPDLPPRTSADQHAPTEQGPRVAMRAMAPVAALDDPGIGLRQRSWKVLTYADLQSPWLSPGDPPNREIVLHLTGNMERYMWSLNGIPFADAQPLKLHYGERVRITLVNDSMMPHPIHLHGMWSDLELGGNRLLRKHTIVVKPGEKLSYQVAADAPGRWAYHCHLLYHMAAGMFREVRVIHGQDDDNGEAQA